MKREVEMYLIAALLLGIVFLFAFFQPNFTGTGYAVYEQSGQSDFNLGTHNSTIYDVNSSAIILDVNQTSGTYISKIFDSNNSNTTWNNLTYVGNSVDIEVRACDSSDCSDENFSSVNLGDLGLVAQYFQYRVDFSKPVNGTASLESVVVDYSLPEAPVPEENVSIIITSPEGEQNSLTGISLEFTTTGNNLDCWYNINEGNNTSLSNCESTSFDVSEEGEYNLSVYANGTTLESDMTTFNVVLPTCSNDLSLCLDETNCTDIGGGYWYDDQCNANEQSTQEEQTTEEPQIVETTPVETAPQTNLVTKLSISKIPPQGLSPGESKVFAVSAKNAGNTPLSSCKLSVTGVSKDWVKTTDKSVSLNPSESKSLSFTLSIPQNWEATTHTVKTDVLCLQKSVSSTFNLEIIPITFEFDITNVRKIKSDEVRATYNLADLSGQDQTINLKFVLFDNKSVKVSEATDSINLTANESNSFRSAIPINKTIEGDLTIHAEVNAQKYNHAVDEPIVLGGAPLLGFVAFGDVVSGTGGAILLVAVLLALVIIIFVVRRIRRKSKNLRK